MAEPDSVRTNGFATCETHVPDVPFSLTATRTSVGSWTCAVTTLSPPWFLHGSRGNGRPHQSAWSYFRRSPGAPRISPPEEVAAASGWPGSPDSGGRSSEPCGSPAAARAASNDAGIPWPAEPWFSTCQCRNADSGSARFRRPGRGAGCW